MRYIVRDRNSSINKNYESSKTLDFLYGNFFGYLILKLLTTKIFANMISIYMNSFLSKPLINKKIKKCLIDMNEFQNKKYNSYNDFFTRKIKENKRTINKNKNVFISPCDSVLNVHTITKDLTLNIKGHDYSIDELVEKDIIDDYINGQALIFRLREDNYHRYCYIDNGTHNENIKIKGKLHTVQPISLKKYNYLKTNSREYTILNTENFDKVIHVEIGAMCIGKIKNKYENYKFIKGEEKGNFEFGGSTIVLLVKKDIIEIDKDILENSINGIETIVKYGERVGIKKTSD